MRVMIMLDIHGNRLALDAVLADVERLRHPGAGYIIGHLRGLRQPSGADFIQKHLAELRKPTDV